METMGFMFGLIAFCWCCSLSRKVSKLERLIKQAEIDQPQKDSLREILQKHQGKSGKIQFAEGATDIDIFSKTCYIEDVDEEWVLVRVGKGEMEKLIRIDSIQGIQFH